MRSRVARAVSADSWYNPGVPLLNEQTVWKLINVTATLEELDLRIGMGNAELELEGDDSIDSLCEIPAEGNVQSTLRKLKLVYDPYWIYDAFNGPNYDPYFTPAFLTPLATSAAHTLTHLDLQLLLSGAQTLHLADFSGCTALESVNIGIHDDEAGFLDMWRRYPGRRFPSFSPGTQFSGSRATLKKLELSQFVMTRLPLFTLNRLFEDCRMDDGTMDECGGGTSSGF